MGVFVEKQVNTKLVFRAFADVRVLMPCTGEQPPEFRTAFSVHPGGKPGIKLWIDDKMRIAAAKGLLIEQLLRSGQGSYGFQAQRCICL